jgi:hypothetical protein
MTDPSPTDAAPSSKRQILITLAYLWPLALIPLVLARNDPEIQWHTRHGLVLMAGEICTAAVLVVLSTALGGLLGRGYVTAIVAMLLDTALVLGIVTVQALAIVRGVRGDRLILLPRRAKL